MSWKVELARRANKALQKAPKTDQRRLIEALKELQEDPLNRKIDWLKNAPPAHKRRVGSWRILFDVDPVDRVVSVVDIRRRTSKTYRKR